MALTTSLSATHWLCLLTTLLITISLHSTTTTAHFLLNHPPTIGFNDDLEGIAPCGSFTVDFTKDNVTNFYVGGDSIAVTSTHPMATWLFRATLDQSATSGNWTSVLPAVVQSGLGNFCERDVVVPTSWAGKKGVVGVVQDATDGLLYQCAAVSFLPGPAPSTPSACVNATGSSATFTADAVLSSIPASESAAPTDMPSSMASAGGSMTTGTGGPAPSSTGATKSEAGMLMSAGVMMMMMMMVVVGVVTVGVAVV